MEERVIHRDASVVTHQQAAEVAEPSDRPLHLPASPIAPQLSPILPLGLGSFGAVRANQIDSPLFQPISQRIGIRRPVVNQPLGILPGPSSARSGNGHAIQRRFDQRRLVRRGRGELNSQRNTLAACHHHPLCTLAAFGFSDAGTPFFAGAKLPSAKVSSQSMRPCSSSCPRKVRQRSSQTSCSSQSRNRRQQVLGDGYCWGKSFHRAPLRSTQRMPSKQRRSLTRWRPPLEDGLAFGSSGSILLHCSSVSSESCRAMKRTPFHGVLKPKSMHRANLCAVQF
jgi:hypothetical protein